MIGGLPAGSIREGWVVYSGDELEERSVSRMRLHSGLNSDGPHQPLVPEVVPPMERK